LPLRQGGPGAPQARHRVRGRARAAVEGTRQADGDRGAHRPARRAGARRGRRHGDARLEADHRAHPERSADGRFNRPDQGGPMTTSTTTGFDFAAYRRALERLDVAALSELLADDVDWPEVDSR